MQSVTLSVSTNLECSVAIRLHHVEVVRLEEVLCVLVAGVALDHGDFPAMGARVSDEPSEPPGQEGHGLFSQVAVEDTHDWEDHHALPVLSL